MINYKGIKEAALQTRDTIRNRLWVNVYADSLTGEVYAIPVTDIGADAVWGERPMQLIGRYDKRVREGDILKRIAEIAQ